MSQYIASDYAGFSSGEVSCYYGYEVTDKHGNWCFEATVNGEKITIPVTDLKVKDTFDPGECLLAGVVELIARKILVPA